LVDKKVAMMAVATVDKKAVQLVDSMAVKWAD
jgi:hypothetical protein